MNVETETEAAQIPFLGIHKWDFHCSVQWSSFVEMGDPEVRTSSFTQPLKIQEIRPSRVFALVRATNNC
jgi:hypothetical protein